MSTRRSQRNKSKAGSTPKDDDSDHTPVKANTQDDELFDTQSDASTKSKDASNQGWSDDDIEVDNDNVDNDTNDNEASNPHSAQANLNKSLAMTTYEKKLQELSSAAAANSAKRKERAIRKRAKRRQNEALAKQSKTKDKTTHSIKRNAPSSDADSISSSSTSSDSSSSDESRTNKKKAASKKKSSKTKDLQHNTYAILNASSKSSSNKARMSKAERKRKNKLQRDHRTFFCAKIYVKTSTNGMEELLKQTKSWFDKMRKYDSTSIIYAYKDDKPNSALFSASEIPDSLVPFRNYFNNASIKNVAGHVWVNMYIGHTAVAEKILKHMKEYRDLTDTWTFVKKLQARFVSRDYFLLWSTDYMDTTALTSEVHKEIGYLTNKKFQFAFTWSPIKGPDNRIYHCAKQDRYKKSELSALHIQVPSDAKEETYDMLSNFFGLNTEAHIFQRRMMMVPVIKADYPAHKNENIEHLIAKQSQFYASMEYAKSYDFLKLDRPEKNLEITARDMVMKLKTLDGRDSKLFWSIDQDNTGAFNLSFPSHLDPQARDIVAQLPSLLHFAYGKHALSLLTSTAAKKALAAPWDPHKMRAVSKADKTLEAMIIATNEMMNGINDTDLSDIESDNDSIDTAAELDGDVEQATREYLWNRASSNASVSTLDTRIGHRYKASKPSPNKVEPSPTKKRKGANDDDDEENSITSPLLEDMDFALDSETGADMDGKPDQQRPLTPEPERVSGAGS